MSGFAERDQQWQVDLSEKADFQGLVQVYTGNGKGKTTAALGLAVRATGQGMRVYVAQFMKGVPYGELTTLALIPNLTIEQFGRPSWVHESGVTAEDRASAEEGLKAATAAIQCGQYDLVILDEINLATSWNLIPIEKIVDLIKMKPAKLELVLTGRQAPQEIIELADYVTEMCEIKHPYQKGINSRRGIEF